MLAAAALASLIVAQASAPAPEIDVVTPQLPAGDAPAALSPAVATPGVDPALVSLVREEPRGRLDRLVSSDPRLRALDQDRRKALLDSVAEPSSGGAVAANVLLGFGIGSMASGDERGAALLVGDVVGLGMYVFGGLNSIMRERTSPAVGVGLVIFGASRVAGFVLPGTYHGRRYEALEEAFAELDHEAWRERLRARRATRASAPAVELAPFAVTDRGLAPGGTLALRF